MHATYPRLQRFVAVMWAGIGSALLPTPPVGAGFYKLPLAVAQHREVERAMNRAGAPVMTR